MEDTLLFKASMAGQFWSLGVSVVFILVLLFRKRIIKILSLYLDFEQLGKIFSVKKCGPITLKVMMAFLVLMLILDTLAVVDEYQAIYRVYKDGAYLTTEGKVEDFTTTKSSESFTVEGVDFAYEARVNSVGYHKVLAQRGVISGNGQKVRIGYVPYEGENKIVLIEAIK